MTEEDMSDNLMIKLRKFLDLLRKRLESRYNFSCVLCVKQACYNAIKLNVTNTFYHKNVCGKVLIDIKWLHICYERTLTCFHL